MPLFGPPCYALTMSLYPQYADYGWASIPQADFDASGMEQDELAVLDAVHRTYGDLDGNQLERLTHSEKPWRDARQGLKPWETCTATISCEAMGRYYKEKYEQAQGE